ncbi:septal ring lytic transglycosylase RlpA family protein [Xanthovirga aplysinae]|uniref:septal ring lytic transglycosylase RlpA family protein n=1 Tax=Xanthovirga aplysinae TaxID=2529853 RepID=UPI0031B5C1C1
MIRFFSKRIPISFLCIFISISTFCQLKEPQTGLASYYANKFEGRLTANGERFSNAAFTAAHRTLPFGTQVKVTNLKNKKSVVVRINDRGPFVKGRIIDLSSTAMMKLGGISAGLIKVRLEIWGGNSKKPRNSNLVKMLNKPKESSNMKKLSNGQIVYDLYLVSFRKLKKAKRLRKQLLQKFPGNKFVISRISSEQKRFELKIIDIATREKGDLLAQELKNSFSTVKLTPRIKPSIQVEE